VYKFDILEIDAYANLIEFLALYKDFHGPIVPMGPCTIARVTLERMGG